MWFIAGMSRYCKSCLVTVSKLLSDRQHVAASDVTDILCKTLLTRRSDSVLVVGNVLLFKVAQEQRALPLGDIIRVVK